LSSEHRLGGRASRRRWRLVAVVGVFVAIAAVVGAVLTVLHQGDTQTAGLGGPTPATVPPAGGSQPGGGPRPPAQGAYLGAYVQPNNDYTPQGRIDAVTAFEKATGRQLDVVQSYHPWTDDFPDATDNWVVDSDRKLLLSWAGTDTRMIQTGRYDGLIRQRARAVKALGKPIFLRWRWEMDRPNLQASIWTPQDYIAAWRHIRTIFAAEKVTNVSWVWCPTAAGFADSNRAAAYYPGDSEVDWLCADVYPGVRLEDTFGSAAAGFLSWAKGHSDKPIMIAEWATTARFPGGQTAWLDQAEKTAQDNPSIKALVYFDSNTTSAPRQQLKLSGAAVGRFADLLADPYFNTRRLPVGR
jgi:hypothetical protein